MSITVGPGFRPSAGGLPATLPVVPAASAPVVAPVVYNVPAPGSAGALPVEPSFVTAPVTTQNLSASYSSYSYSSYSAPIPTATSYAYGAVPAVQPVQPAKPSTGAVFAAPVAGAKPDEESSNSGGAFTRGFPDPASIEEQKAVYSKSLEVQLEQGNASLQQQNLERKKQLKEAAEQQKQALLLHMEQQVKMQEMALDEQTNQAMMGLKKAALDQRAALEQQAASLTLEYQQRKMQEEFAATQAEMRRQYVDSATQLQSEVQRHYNESHSKFQTELQRQQQERSEKLGESPPPLPGAKYAAPLVRGPTYAPQTMTASYTSLPPQW